jgi:hypothetical protein
LNDRRARLLDAFERFVSSHVLSVMVSATGLRLIRALKKPGRPWQSRFQHSRVIHSVARDIASNEVSEALLKIRELGFAQVDRFLGCGSNASLPPAFVDL